MKTLLLQAHHALEHLQSRVSREYYPQLHLAPPAGWMNDPNGLIYFDGAYHVFYQHHPHDENWGPMHWGHARSTDLVHWQHLPIALAPGTDDDKDGCFSGSAVEHNGELCLLYTGHVWLGESGDDGQIREVQCLATSTDGVHFTKQGTVLAAPEGIRHFRDPKVWKEGDDWMMVVGARTPDDLGQVLLYRSPDLRHWTPEPVLARAEPGQGYMWECPDFFPLGDRHLLLFSPQGMAAEGYRFRNLHQSGYLLGRWQPGQAFDIEQPFTELDAGHDFYAPQTFTAADGRRLLIGWMDMWESPMPSKAHYWAGALTLPRELSLDDKGRVRMQPARELAELRRQHEHWTQLALTNERKPLGLDAHALELQVTLDLSASAERFGLELAATTDGSRGALLYVDAQAGRLVLDRSRAGLGVSGYRSIPLPAGPQLELRIFIDHSSLEVFVNRGEACLTSRIYPQPGERTINLFAENGSAEVVAVHAWRLGSIWR